MDINLVLSGGGARGLAHLGMIKVIRESGFNIRKISGVSTGSVVGAFIAAGFSPEETLKVFVENNLMYQIRPVFNGGIFRLTKWEKILMESFPKNTFESLAIPLTVNVTDINECKTVFINSGPLIRPLLASCSIPGIFEPIVLGDRQCVDGGVLNNLPVEPFQGDSNKIIALHVNPLIFENEIDSAFIIFERSVQLSIRDNTNERKKLAHIVLEPPGLSRFQIFDLNEAKAIFNIGYEYAKSRVMDIENIAMSTS